MPEFADELLQDQKDLPTIGPSALTTRANPLTTAVTVGVAFLLFTYIVGKVEI